VTRDNIVTWRTYADEEWSRLTAADPLTVDDDEPWPNELPELPRNRDGLLLGLGVLLIVAVLAYLLGRAS
jgi:hypothetical protein